MQEFKTPSNVLPRTRPLLGFLTAVVLVSLLSSILPKSTSKWPVPSLEGLRSGPANVLAGGVGNVSFKDDAEEVALCTMVKAAPYFIPVLTEWLTHNYFHHGIRRFYIVDDGSEPPLSSYKFEVPSSAITLSEYIPSGSIPEGGERQGLYENRMEKCVRNAKDKHQWVGLLDIDEFLEMRSPEIFPSLRNWLRFWESQEGVGGVAVQTLSHSSAGLIEQPKEGFRKKFTRCINDTHAPERDNILSITQMKQFVRPAVFTGLGGSIHVSAYVDGYRRVAEDGQAHNSVKRSPKSYKYWALHHYSCGSREYFERKAQVGDSHGRNIFPIDEKYWDYYHKHVEEYDCNEMTKYDP